jgi:antitoxin component YwqK of YwqJK toxin-antitoxin module
MTTLRFQGLLLGLFILTSCNEQFVEKSYWSNSSLQEERIYASKGDYDDCYLHRGYDSIGNLLEEGEILNGQKNGIWEFWDEKGMLKYRKTYREGQVYGMTYYYDDNGVLIDSFDYGYAGETIQRKHEASNEVHGILSTSSQKHIAEFGYKDDFWFTESTFYDPEERMPKSFKGFFNLGADQDYCWLFWDPEGVLLEKGQFRAGLKEGYWEHRGDSLGKISVTSRGHYQQGIKTGLWDYTSEETGAEKDVYHRKGKALLVNFWNGQGKQWVKNGEGMVEGIDEIRIYQDSILLETIPRKK